MNNNGKMPGVGTETCNDSQDRAGAATLTKLRDLCLPARFIQDRVALSVGQVVSLQPSRSSTVVTLQSLPVLNHTGIEFLWIDIYRFSTGLVGVQVRM